LSFWYLFRHLVHNQSASNRAAFEELAMTSRHWCFPLLLMALLQNSAPVAGQHVEDPSDADTESRSTTNLFGLRAAVLDDDIVTDRPDFTESTEAVPWGHFQLEAGYTFTQDDEDGVHARTHSGPELLLRMGVVEDFELRFGWQGHEWTHTRTEQRNDVGRRVWVEDWDQGASDFELGFKLKIAEQSGWRPSLAVLGSLVVPTGSHNTSAGDVEPLLGLLWGYDLSERLAVAGQVLVATPTDAGDRFVQTSASISFAAALTGRLGSYVEYYVITPNQEHSDAAHTVNGGFTYLVHRDLQLDWRIGAGMNEEADDFFTGIGFSWRF